MSWWSFSSMTNSIFLFSCWSCSTCSFSWRSIRLFKLAISSSLKFVNLSPLHKISLLLQLGQNWLRLRTGIIFYQLISFKFSSWCRQLNSGVSIVWFWCYLSLYGVDKIDDLPLFDLAKLCILVYIPIITWLSFSASCDSKWAIWVAVSFLNCSLRLFASDNSSVAFWSLVSSSFSWSSILEYEGAKRGVRRSKILTTFMS